MVIPSYCVVVAYQVENRYFHHTLVEICGAVLDDLHRHDLLCLQILALHDLTKCSLPQDVQDEISVSGRKGQ